MNNEGKYSSIVDKSPNFKIGGVPIYGNKSLSPMAGISDSPHRQLTRKFGSAWSFTEFVSSEQIIIGNPKTIRLFDYSEMERPIWFQIFGNDVDTVTEAAKRIEHLKPDIIDLNMGCSTHKVSQRGSGAALLKDLPLAGKMIESLRRSVNIPITAKIRIGWSNTELNYKETVHVLEESGVQAISVHGRTKEMAYTGSANWNAIAEIKSFAKVPIIGNGDISSCKIAEQRLEETKVDAVLIGRGAIGNPWIFSGREKDSLDFQTVFEVARQHYELMKDFYGFDTAFRLFKKYFVKYFRNFEFYREIKEQIIRLENAQEFEEVWLKDIEKIYQIVKI